ncbi:hypothetical protein SLEP1_g49795 [Rubroshorea leprosula]|uniref:Uncharacterized protein n=1 Tax=Rubroshorea leprosula TaxID=152421 RepID=A0AAV5M005_9ROSI|nr:hypothetical protein SLEP1_g49795 [Rubroshorea leprosula]
MTIKERVNNKKRAIETSTCNFLVVISATIDSPISPMSYDIPYIQFRQINLPLLCRPLALIINVSRPNPTQVLLQLHI